MKIRAEINEKEMKETIVKINKTKSCFFEKTKNWQTFSQTHQEKKRENTQINKIRNEKGEVTTENAQIQRIMRLLWTTLWQ